MIKENRLKRLASDLEWSESISGSRPMQDPKNQNAVLRAICDADRGADAIPVAMVATVRY